MWRDKPVEEEIRELITALALAPHPEGGFYRETFRSLLEVPSGAGIRAASTAIYFLLPPETFSAWHRVTSDEVWHFYDGDPLMLHQLGPFGHRQTLLGRDLAAGQRPQATVPAGVLQAAVTTGSRWSLCGCTVAPGFDFADFRMPTRQTLLQQYPEHHAVITRFTR